MPSLLRVEQLVKSFPGVRAVNGVSFDVETGCCFGLLGPNGAGKTTCIEMMEGITRPDAGQILFKGKSLDSDYAQRIGIQFQHTALQDFLTVKDTLRLFQCLYANPRSLPEVVELCALGELLERDTRKLSGGQRQRLLLGVALISDPELLFLDEPTTGLDPQSRHHFWALIRIIRARGTTILLTTHYMEEAELLCDRILIMDRGEIVAEGSPDGLLKQHFKGVLLSLPHSSGVAAVQTCPFDLMQRERGQIEQRTELVVRDIEPAIRWLLKNRVNLSGMRVTAPNLEDLFIKLTGHSLRR
jgi:ABC-2 type transport system ATP-binding protein